MDSSLASLVASHPLAVAAAACVAVLLVYLAHIDCLLRGTPDEVLGLAQTPWTPAQIKDVYRRVGKNPVDARAYRDQLPPRLDRRYVVTGGSGECSASAAEPFRAPIRHIRPAGHDVGNRRRRARPCGAKVPPVPQGPP